MSHSHLVRWLAGVSAVAAFNVAAQGAVPAQAPPPGSSQSASVPAFRSALEGYQAYADDKPIGWKDANDTVGKVGGWRAYAAEAQRAPQEAVPPATPAAGASASPPVDPHGGHRKP